MLHSENKFVTEPIKVSKNPVDLLKHKESNTINVDIVDDSNITNKYPSIISDSNITEIQNHVKTQNNLKKRPSVVTNHFPENQSVFRKKQPVPGENSYSEALKSKINSQNIRIFSDSIAKGIKVKQFNQFVKIGNARIYSFPGATLKQLLHYLDVNHDSTADNVILHIGINILISIDHKEELYSSRPLCNKNDAVSENCKNEDMYNASNISNPCDTLY